MKWHRLQFRDHGHISARGKLKSQVANACQLSFRGRHAQMSLVKIWLEIIHTCARWSTLDVWPVSSAIFTIDGYFHRHSWFWLNPCELKISRSCLLHCRAQTCIFCSQSYIRPWRIPTYIKYNQKNTMQRWQGRSRSLLRVVKWRICTCDLVSILLTQAPVCVFQNLMQRSAVPPPEASKLLWNGHHAKAFTAAWWSSKRWRYGLGPWIDPAAPAAASQIWTRLSFPPLASCWPVGDHFSPHISCSCASNLSVMWSRILTAWLFQIQVRANRGSSLMGNYLGRLSFRAFQMLKFW